MEIKNLMGYAFGTMQKIKEQALWDPPFGFNQYFFLQTANEYGITVWRPMFSALTLNDLLFYESVPMLKSEWAFPKVTRPLIATRVVQTTSR